MILKDLENLEPKIFLIIGFGMTGKALAEFFETKNWSYFVIEDSGTINWNGKCFLGQVVIGQNELWQLASGENIKTTVKAAFPSPGISPTNAAIMWTKRNNIPMIGELELASFYLNAEFIGVTGTNGKSTTVKLIEALLKNAGITTGLKGNIGAPLITAVSEEPKEVYVIEESSYQTEQIGTLRHKISVCLNVTDDHFDRYKSIEDYAAAKELILQNANADDFFIFNQDDPHCLKMSWRSKAKVLPFSLVQKLEMGGFVDGNAMRIRLNQKEYDFDLQDCSLRGLHNQENMLAALMSVLLIRADESAVTTYKKTLSEFKGLPHRVEKVLSQNGIDYFDDSKATNVGSVVMALASFENNVILIAGGRDKLGDYSPLKGLAKHKVKKLILLGEAKHRIEEALGQETDTELVETMKDAVNLAKQTAKTGDVVLLSPACSSFDQYKNYHERGLDFQKWVREL